MPGEHVVAVHQLLPGRGGADVAPVASTSRTIYKWLRYPVSLNANFYSRCVTPEDSVNSLTNPDAVNTPTNTEGLEETCCGNSTGCGWIFWGLREAARQDNRSWGIRTIATPFLPSSLANWLCTRRRAAPRCPQRDHALPYPGVSQGGGGIVP